MLNPLVYLNSSLDLYNIWDGNSKHLVNDWGFSCCSTSAVSEIPLIIDWHLRINILDSILSTDNDSVVFYVPSLIEPKYWKSISDRNST